MDFTFSPEQDALRDAVRATLAAEAPSAYVRRMIDDDAGVSPELWAKLADLGWLGLLVPEGHGDPVERVRATADGDVLGGLKPAVPDGHAADWAIVAARTEQGLGSFLLDQPGGELVPSLDVTRKVARLDLAGRRGRAIGPPG